MYDFRSHIRVTSSSGAQVYGHCPWRKDRNPSFSANESTGLWSDHGTNESGNYSQFLEKIGLDKSASSKSKAKKDTKVSKEYIYLDDKGRRRLKVSRIDINSEEKRFYQSHWNGIGWSNGKGSGEIAPYQYHEKWKNSPDFVYFVEGEKACNKLLDEGLNATCIPRGCYGWKKQYAKYFKGKSVIILPDNDNEGKKFARKVLSDLTAVAAFATIVELPRLKKNKEDIVEWIELYDGSKNELLELTHTTYTNKKPQSKQLSKVKPEKVTWLWKERIPLKAMTLLTGDPGVGKSYLSANLAAIVSQGQPLPCGQSCTPQKVIMFCVEDDLSRVVRPRLERMNARLENIFAYPELMSLDSEKDREIFERLVVESKAKLIILDPLMGYIGGKLDSNKANEVRAVIQHLGKLAEKHDLAIVCIRHAVKASSGAFGKIKGIHYGQGSIDFTALSRSEFVIIDDPEKENEKLFIHVKSNYCQKKETLAYAIEGEKIKWLGEREYSDRNLGGTGGSDSEEKTKTSEAIELAKDFLREGKIPSTELVENLKEMGISERTWRRAKAALGPQIEISREKDKTGKMRVYLSLAPLTKVKIGDKHV